MKPFTWLRKFVRMNIGRTIRGNELLDVLERSIKRDIEERNRLAEELAKQKRISYSQARAWMLYGERTWPNGYTVTEDDL